MVTVIADATGAGIEVDGADALWRAAQQALMYGPRWRTADGGDQPALLGLVALAAHRSDWRACVDAVCRRVALDEPGHAALWLALAEAPAGVLLLELAEAIGARTTDQTTTLARLRETWQQRSRRPMPLLLPDRLLVLAEPGHVRELVMHLLDRADTLTPRAGLDGWQTLWQLRDVELTQPWTRAPLGEALAEGLADPRPEVVAAVVEFLCVSGDVATRRALLATALTGDDAALDADLAPLPSGLELADLLAPDVVTLRQALTALVARAAAERPPVD